MILYGDYYIAHTYQSVDIEPIDFGPLPENTWALTGATGGSGGARLVSPLGDSKQRDDVGYDLSDYYHRVLAHQAEMIASVEPMVETGHLDDAEVVVVAFGTPGKFVRYVVNQLREEGVPVGYVRPITLFPFPTDAVRAAAEAARVVGVYENSAGQMIDDVRLAVLGAAPVEAIGGLTLDGSGFGIGPDITVPEIRARILRLCESAGCLPDRSDPMTDDLLRILPTDAPPAEGAHLVDDFTPQLIDVGAHNLCPGCGEPIAMRSVMEVIAEQGLMQRAIAVFGIGCYTAFSNNLDCEVLQALHGRAPSLATGVKRAQARHHRRHHPGRRRHGERGPPGGRARRRPRRADHLHPAQQRRVRRDRRPHDRHHHARPAHQELARGAQRRRPRLPDPDGLDARRARGLGLRRAGRGEHRRQRRAAPSG